MLQTSYFPNEPNSNSTIKILLATDNHVGYLERDPIRGGDSFNTFREILQMAKDHDVRSLSLSSVCFPNQTTELQRL